MAEIPAGDYFHRSIDQLRSMNDRGVLGSLGHLTTTDLRAAHLVQEYKPFDIVNLRQNMVDRLDYTKNGLDNNTVTVSHRQQHQNGNLAQHNNQHIDGGGHSTNHHQQAGDDVRHDQQQQQQHHQQQQQQQMGHDMKQSYSAPSTPPTPLSIADAQMGEPKVRKKVLTALNFYARGCYQGSVGQNHLLGLSQPSVSRCIRVITNLIVNHLLDKLIKFPRTLTERVEVQQRFYTKFGMPCVLGAIDGTHIAIVSPPEMSDNTRGNLFINRKGYHSLNVLVLFTQKSDMLHMREAKPYKCSQCTKAFANSSYLSQHTRIHLGIKPYRCEICQRKFTQLSHLQQHIRTHTGDKPYKCRNPGCQKAFSQLSNLQSHSRCHQTDKPYKCNSCYKCFSDEQALLEHIPKHKESKHLKTHICSFCGKSYTQETYLQKHLQKHAEKAEKQSRNSNAANSGGNSGAGGGGAGGGSGVQNAITASGVSLATGLGLNLNRNIAAMNVAAANGEHSYWPKVSPDSAASLAEAMQQQQQTTYEFALAQQQSELQNHHRTLLEHHNRTLNGTANGGNSSQNSNEEGEDLVVSRQQQNAANNLAQHLSNQQQVSPVGNNSVVTSNGNYDTTGGTGSIAKTTTNSAFTPINTMTPHINSLSHHPMQRPYLYDAIQFQTKNVNQNTTNAFPNQLISLHQIRNYAHQPGAAGLMAGEHLLGIGVGTGGGKEKAQ